MKTIEGHTRTPIEERRGEGPISRQWFWRALALPLLLVGLGTLVPTTTSRPAAGAIARKRPFMRGMTVSCWHRGHDWGVPELRRTLRELRRLGVTWVAVHPYAWIKNHGQLSWNSAEDAHYVTAAAREAHALGLKLYLTPHLGYWGSRFGWRGEIAFSREAQWRTFFADYRRWIDSLARLAQTARVDLLSVGNETERTHHRVADWRAVIETARARYRGPLTYAANWSKPEAFALWPQLDYIGVQAYFPLTRAPNPSTEQIRAGWKRHLERLRRLSRKHRRPVVFNEIGYNLSARAAARPWDYTQGGPGAEQIQLRAVTAALTTIEQQPWIAGMFFWKWFPTAEERKGDFRLQYPAMKRVFSRYWGKPLQRLLATER